MSVFCNEIAKFVKISCYLLKKIGVQESFMYRVLLLLEINGTLEAHFRE